VIFSYNTECREGKFGRARRSKTTVCLSMFNVTEKNFPLLISTKSLEFSYNDFYTTLYFVSQRNYKILTMQAHTLTQMHYFYSLRQ
jgi:hypothetical protein